MASKINKLVVFLLGFTIAFVKSEPSFYDILLLILFFRNIFSKQLLSILIVFVILNISTLFSYNIQRSLEYNLITLLLFSSLLYFKNIDRKNWQYFITGNITSLLVTYFLGFIILQDNYWYYSRFMGGYKDPNVFSPSLLMILMIAFKLNFRKRIISFLTFPGMLLAQSRAVYGALGLVLFHRLRRNILFYGFTIMTALYFGPLLVRKIALKSYDTNRFLGQIHALQRTSLFGNGSTSSDYFVGHPPHSLYVRMISDIGLLPCLFIVILALAIYNRVPRALSRLVFITPILLISFVIDTVHWRMFYVFLGFSYSYVFDNSRAISKAA